MLGAEFLKTGERIIRVDDCDPRALSTLAIIADEDHGYTEMNNDLLDEEGSFQDYYVSAEAVALTGGVSDAIAQSINYNDYLKTLKQLGIGQ